MTSFRTFLPFTSFFVLGILFACSTEVHGTGPGDGDGDGDTPGDGDGDGGAPGDGDGGAPGDGDGDTPGDGDGDGDTPGDGDGDGDTPGDGDGDGDTPGDGDGDGDTPGDGDGDIANVALEVLGVTPADGTDAVARDFPRIIVEFNNDLSDESVDTSSVYVTGPYGAVPAQVAVSGANVELDLEDDLLLLATYSVHVLPSVEDDYGGTLESEFIATFTTVDGALTATAPVEDGASERIGSAAPETGIADNGDMLVVYQLQDENQAGLAPQARWYRQTTGWEGPVDLDTSQTSTCDDLNVAVNPSGQAVAAWRCGDVAYIRQYRDGNWESTRQALPDAASGRVHVKMLPSGAVIGAYQRPNSNYFTYFWSTDGSDFAVESSEGQSAPNIDDEMEYDAFDLSINSSGNALLLWAVRNSVTDARSIAYSRYAASSNTWTQPALIPDSTAEDGQLNPAGALSDDDEAMAIWVEIASPSNHDLKASRFTLAGGWGDAVEIDVLDSQLNQQPRLVREGSGEYLAAFSQSAAIANIYTSRFSAGSWSGPDLVSDGILNAQYPLLASDGRGNSLLVWGYDIDTSHLTDPLLLQSLRYSHFVKEWVDISPSPDEPVYMNTMGLTLTPAGYGALTWIGISGSVYQGNPAQRIDVSLKRFE